MFMLISNALSPTVLSYRPFPLIQPRDVMSLGKNIKRVTRVGAVTDTLKNHTKYL